MNPYNPYAAPITGAAGPGPAPGIPPRGQPVPWEVGESLSHGWQVYKANWPALTFGYLIISLIGMLPGQIAPALLLAGVLEQGSRTYYAVHVPFSFVGWLLMQFFTVGFIRASLKATRTNSASFGDFFGGANRFLPFVLAELLRTLAVAFGLLLLLVPGVILALGLSNSPYFVVEQELGPVEALRASWASTDGQKGNLFILGLTEIGIILLGFLACCLGMFVAVPLMVVVRGIVYMKMAGTTAGAYPQPMAPASPYGAFGPPGGGPPGYGGGPPGY